MTQEQATVVAALTSKELLEAVRDRLRALPENNDNKRAIFQVEAALASRVIRGVEQP